MIKPKEKHGRQQIWFMHCTVKVIVFKWNLVGKHCYSGSYGGTNEVLVTSQHSHSTWHKSIGTEDIRRIVGTM